MLKGERPDVGGGERLGVRKGGGGGEEVARDDGRLARGELALASGEALLLLGVGVGVARDMLARYEAGNLAAVRATLPQPTPGNDGFCCAVGTA